jgi:hypothetical protein
MAGQWLLFRVRGAEAGKKYVQQVVFRKRDLLTTDKAIAFLSEQ